MIPLPPFELLYQEAGDGCWVWQGACNIHGYGRYKKRGAHRVAYERFKGPIPNGLVVRHKCDNPPCVNPDHLELGTLADNSRDMVLRGRAHKWNGDRRGSSNPRARLSPSQVLEIRDLKGKVGGHQTASRYGVSQSAVQNIWDGRTWAWLQSEDLAR